MRLILSLILLTTLGCSSLQNKPADSRSTISNEDFKKTVPLKPSEVADYYAGNVKALSPALENETIERHSNEEALKLAGEKDPLGQIALKCSQGNFEESFLLANKLFNTYQKIPVYWNQIANCHLKQGSSRKALLFYNKALEVSPNYVPALNNIGVLYSRQGQDQKALVAFERAYNESRFAKTPRFNLARIYLKYGLTDLALPILEGLLEGAPLDTDLLNSVASAHFFKGDYQKAVSVYQKIPGNLWSRAEIGLNMSWALKKIGQIENARKIFDSIAKPQNNSLKAYYAVVEQKLGER
jgi:tetratricopeptide (TPR) repeat protein